MRRRFSKDLLKLRVSQLHRVRAFRDGEAGSMEIAVRREEQTLNLNLEFRAPELRLILQQPDGFRYPEQIVLTSEEPCNFGGTRTWLHCPETTCGKRVGVLYLIDSRWKCRGCAGVEYPSKQLSRILRMRAKAKRLRDHLGPGSALFEDFPPRPLGMHLRTYKAAIVKIFQLEVDLLNLQKLETERVMSAHLGYTWEAGQPLNHHWNHILEEATEE